MVEGIVEKLNALDPAILAEIVRMDQNNPSFEITEWSMKRLSDKGLLTPTVCGFLVVLDISQWSKVENGVDLL